jgi:uncharacterized membrane-anchored protein YhcB (DUF1043 family)
MSACTNAWWVPLAIYAALAVGCAVGVLVACLAHTAGKNEED